MSLRDKLIEAIRDEGWVCEYHEPDPSCEVCRRLHAQTLDAMLDMLEANADEWATAVGLPTPPDIMARRLLDALQEKT